MKNNLRELYKDSNKRSRRSERINVSVQLREDRRKGYLELKRKEAVTSQCISTDTGSITTICNDLVSNNYNATLNAVKNLFSLLDNNADFSMDQFCEFDVVSPIINLLRAANTDEDKLSVAAALVLIFEKEPSLLRRLQLNDHFDLLFNMLLSSTPVIADKLFNIITLVSTYMSDMNESIIQHGFVDTAFLAISGGCLNTTFTHISFILASFSSKQYSNMCTSNEVVCRIISLIDVLFKVNHEIICENALKALSHITSLSSKKINFVLNTGILETVKILLDHAAPQVLDPAVLVFGNIVSGNDDNTQKVIDMGVVDKIFPLLNNQDENVRKHVLWLLSNVCAGTVAQVNFVYSRQMFYQIYNHFLHDNSVNKREALWIISNILYIGTEMHIKELLNLSLIKDLCDVLKQSVDKESILVALDSVAFIFERSGLTYEFIVSELRAYGGDELIYELCEHPSSKISSLCNEIIHKYLDTYDYIDDMEEFEEDQGINFM